MIQPWSERRRSARWAILRQRSRLLTGEPACALEPRQARVRRPLGRGHEARPGRRDHRHLGPTAWSATRGCSCRSTCRRSSWPRGWRRAHGAAALGAERARRPGAGLPAAVHRRHGASGRRPPPLGAPRRPPAGPAGRDAGPQPAGAPALPDRWVVLRLLTPGGGDDGGGARAGCSRPTGRCRSTSADWPAGSAAATPAGAPAGTGRADRRRGRRADVGRHLRLGRATGSRSTTRSTTWPSWRPTASPATPRRTWWPAGGRTRRSTPSTPPTTPAAWTRSCTRWAGAR